MANDGDQTTRWNADANASGDEWLEIDFGVNTTFDRTVISESFDRIASYTIQYWNNSSWVSAVTGATIGASKTDRFTAVTASKVRLYINTSSATPSINEFEVYNGDTYLDASSLLDVESNIVNGNLNWSVPTGTWKIMKFTWGYQGSQLLDLATQSAADWFVTSVVKPHYDNTGATNILGFFYDEPEFYGTWGLGMERDSPHWKEIMVSRFFSLGGEDQQKATYEYWEALGERLGRVGYGTYRQFVNSKSGLLTGHGNEENAYWMGSQWGKGDRTPLSHGWGQTNMMEVQKYQDIPGIDMLGGQIAVRESRYWTYQLPKLISSIAITNNLHNHYAMNEIFGVAGELNYQSRKWWGDWCQVHGCNFLIPHAVNPKGSTADPDPDCPPFYLYNGDEANWPNYKAWCERQNRLSYMLSGNDSANYSIAPVAVLWPGYSKYVDSTWNDDNCYPYTLQTGLDRVHYDNNLLTYNRFDSTATINAVTKQIHLYNSRYKILILPPVQYIPYSTLNKVKQFYDNGGVVIGWQRVPTKSAKFGNSNGEVQALSIALFNSLTPSTSTIPIKTNANGGKTYFITATDENTVTANLRSILSNSGVSSDFTITSGSFDAFTGYNHRKKDGMDVFMVWNGAASGATITVRVEASGEPELWNPTTQRITLVDFTRISSSVVEIPLSIPAEESYLIVFKPSAVGTAQSKMGAALPALTVTAALPNLISRSAMIRYSLSKRQHVVMSIYSA
ncbi:MAG TPA: glycosyl hydrolase, partial [Armatimonadota bacterium]|nr:glycosyl hydrolase [Armatimonadota bacterium]